MRMLKEWSTVVGAMEDGLQTVTLRKGGILEAASGFVIESSNFLIYPTWEHQSRQNIRAPFYRYLDRPEPEPGTNTITSYARVLAEADISSDDAIARLEKFHIWSPAYIQSRRAWKPENPIKAILLQVYLIEPITIPVLDEYAGCKSWLDIDMDMPQGRPAHPDMELSLQEFRRVH